MPSPEETPRSAPPRRFFTPTDGGFGAASLPPADPRDTARAVVNQIAEMRDSISFAELKRRAEYLAGEPLHRYAPGMWRFDHLVKVDPTPIDTPAGRIFDVYRFSVSREFGPPHAITSTSFDRDAIQFEGHPTLGREILGVRHGECSLGEHRIRVAPRGAVTLTRALLREVHVQILDAAEFQSSHFRDISRVLIGTARTLECTPILRPFSIFMVDRRAIEPGERGDIGWIDSIEERAHGEHIRAAVERISGVVFDHAITLRNEGDVAFHLMLNGSPIT